MPAPISSSYADSLLHSLREGYHIELHEDNRDHILNNFPELRQYLLQKELLEVIQEALRVKLEEYSYQDD